MKKLTFFAFVLVVSGCKAESPPNADHSDKLFATISSEKIFATSFSKLMKQLDGVCKLNSGTGVDPLKDGNVACAKEAAVKELHIGATEDPAVSSIQSVFLGADKCEKMKTALSKQYGKPKVIKAPCYLEWKLKKGAAGQQRMATIQVTKEDAIFFSMEEEQGP